MAKFDHVKNQLYKFRTDNANLSKDQVAKHFIMLGYAKASVYRWLQQIENGDLFNRKKSTGRPVKFDTKTNIKKMQVFFNHKTGCSQRAFARKLGCDHSYVSKMIKRYTSIKCLKRVKKPLLTEKQRKEARPKCRKLLEAYRNHEFVIDDESYFTLSHASIAGNDRFYSNNLQTTPNHIKYKHKAKYEQKLLVWIALSPRGMSKPYFAPSGLAINKFDYVGKCIRPKLLPFLQEHYPNGGYVFWPDLASSH